jgi:DNA-binding transcriptional LysR family regulator
MIDRYLLRYFLAVIDQGSFSKAAVHCNVSQPTLSIGIAKLERLLARPLFLRSNRRVQLTEAGAQFAVHARRIESEFNLAERAPAGDPQRSLLRLGVLASIPTRWISAFAARIAGNDATERVEFVEGRERELLEGLARGRLDAALTIVRADNGRFGGESLVTEGYPLALPDFHPLAREKSIEPGALAADVMIVRRHCEVLSETSRHFTSHGVRPFFATRTTNDDRALALVAAGSGITIMPQGFSAPGVCRPWLAGFDLRRTIGILHGTRFDETRQRSVAMDALREVVGGFGDA